jgi:hypothetical protein
MNSKDFTNAWRNLPSPKTLMQAVKVFSDPDTALRFMVALRWPEQVCCPRCGSLRVRFISTRRLWECREDHPSKRFSIKTGTVLEDSPLPLDKWLVAIWLEVNAKNSISSYEIKRALGITQKSAWFMLHRIRLAVQNGSLVKLGGPTGPAVEVDETYIGGLARNMHKERRKRVITSNGVAGKTAVMGLLERHSGKKISQVRTFVIDDRYSKTLHPIIHKHVEAGSQVMTDELAGYQGLNPAFVHAVINHAEKYVDGIVHTNGLENFWALFKRCIKGTHVSVEPFHLFRYLDAEGFRFNNRDGSDRDRFMLALRGIGGKRLTYKQLTAASEDHTAGDSDAGNADLLN